jgi:hypothetical protein
MYTEQIFKTILLKPQGIHFSTNAQERQVEWRIHLIHSQEARQLRKFIQKATAVEDFVSASFRSQPLVFMAKGS